MTELIPFYKLTLAKKKKGKSKSYWVRLPSLIVYKKNSRIGPIFQKKYNPTS
jgi:hypothetical protein